MAIILKQPVFLNEQGKRTNNEDSIYPQRGQASKKDDLFMVCDGVGGAQKGEVASKMVCIQFPLYFRQNQGPVITPKLLDRSLEYVEKKMTEYVRSHSECEGMATTLTFIYFNSINNRVTVSWSGDSRVYHIRNGEILYRTSDHSLVNELVKRGEITEEEARQHPQRNIILRAVSGSDSPTAVETVFLDDIQAGDYFLLCSDGILESIDDRGLPSLFSHSNMNLKGAANTIKELCDNASRDNFSMYLIQVEEVTPPSEILAEVEMGSATRELGDTGFHDSPPANNQSTTASSPDNSGGSTRLGLMILSSLLGVLMIVGLMWMYKQYTENQVCEQKKDDIRALIANKQFNDATELLGKVNDEGGCITPNEFSTFLIDIDKNLRAQEDEAMDELEAQKAKNKAIPLKNARMILHEDSIDRYRQANDNMIHDSLIQQIEDHYSILDSTEIMNQYMSLPSTKGIDSTKNTITPPNDTPIDTLIDSIKNKGGKLPPSVPVDSTSTEDQESQTTPLPTSSKPDLAYL